MSILPRGAIFASRFEIERLTGSGGTGAVYRARDRFTEEAVAIKVFHGSADQYQESSRLVREGQIPSELRHPGIVRYVTHGQTAEGLCYLAMEWLEGHDLAHCIRQGALSVRDAHIALRSVAEALAVAHRANIVHRDIKPTNLF